MMINAAGTAVNPTPGVRDRSTKASTQKVVIVNGSAGILELLETVLEAGRYDVVFVESNTHAYSQIKRVQPNLVIMCVNIEQMEGFSVLSMLTLDEETREIPILTYTTEDAAQPAEDDVSEPSESALLSLRPSVISMN
jgi:PleD family two-component response regulator